MYTTNSFPHSSSKSRLLSGGQRRGKSVGLTRSAMLLDICLVLAWGATIPGLMWLGVASGL